MPSTGFTLFPFMKALLLFVGFLLTFTVLLFGALLIMLYCSPCREWVAARRKTSKRHRTEVEKSKSLDQDSSSDDPFVVSAMRMLSPQTGTGSPEKSAKRKRKRKDHNHPQNQNQKTLSRIQSRFGSELWDEAVTSSLVDPIAPSAVSHIALNFIDSECQAKSRVEPTLSEVERVERVENRNRPINTLKRLLIESNIKRKNSGEAPTGGGEVKQ